MVYSGHGRQTQRGALHVIATANPHDLESVVARWTAVADTAQTDADLVQVKLSALVTADGWSGAGADTYARAVELEIITPLRALETSARALAASLSTVAQKMTDATSTALTNPIPWDLDTSWHVEQRKLNPVNYVVEKLVDGSLVRDPVATVRAFDSAQADADYQIKGGSGDVVKTISASAWATTEAKTAPMPAVYHGTVSPSVHEFDVWMEYQDMNSGAHAAVAKAADQVEAGLIGFLSVASPASDPTFDQPTATTGLGSGNQGSSGGAVVPSYRSGVSGSLSTTTGGTGDLSSYLDGYTPPGTDSGTPDGGSGTDDGSSEWLPDGSTGQGFDEFGDDTTDGSTGQGSDESDGDPTDGGSDGSGLNFGKIVGTGAAGTSTGFTGSVPAGVGGVGSLSSAGSEGLGLAGSSLAGAGVAIGGAGLGMQAMGGVGMGGVGMGGVGMGGVGMGGVGGTRGLSGLSGISGAAGGSSNPSFQMSSTGRGIASTGSVGGVNSASPATSTVGPAAMAARKMAAKKDDSPADGEGTWLEEDQDVWGTSTVRPDGVIE